MVGIYMSMRCTEGLRRTYKILRLRVDRYVSVTMCDSGHHHTWALPDVFNDTPACPTIAVLWRVFR